MLTTQVSSLLLLGLSLGSFVATQLLALEAHHAAALGSPWFLWGQVPVYAPWDGWRWAWQFACQPAAPFLHAALVLVGMMGLCTARLWTPQPRVAAESRWARRRDL
jgi:hypothetical protein